MWCMSCNTYYVIHAVWYMLWQLRLICQVWGGGVRVGRDTSSMQEDGCVLDMESHHHHRQYCTYNVRTFTRSLMCHDNNDQMKEILFFRNACIYETYDKVTVVSLLLSDMFLQRLWRINLASLLDTGSHVKWLLMWKTWKRLYIKQNPLEWGVNTCVVTASWISYA